MPFYDYKCNKCGKQFEVVHGMNDKPEGLRCEGCGARDVQRVFYPVGTIKASGESFSSGSSCSSCSSGTCSSCGH